jgi:hypothetical protein
MHNDTQQNDTQHTGIQHNGCIYDTQHTSIECLNSECHMRSRVFIVTLNVNVIILSVVMLSVIMLSVVAPTSGLA